MLMFARRLRASRVAAGFEDLSEFAKAIGIPPKRYGKFEDGKKMPEPDELELIARITQRTIEFLVTGRNKNRAKEQESRPALRFTHAG